MNGRGVQGLNSGWLGPLCLPGLWDLHSAHNYSVSSCLISWCLALWKCSLVFDQRLKRTFIHISGALFLVLLLPAQEFTHRFWLPQQNSHLCLFSSQRPLWSVWAPSLFVVWTASSNRKPGQCEAHVSLLYGSQTCIFYYLIMENHLFHVFCTVFYLFTVRGLVWFQLFCYGWQKNSNNFLKNNFIKYFFSKEK